MTVNKQNFAHFFQVRVEARAAKRARAIVLVVLARNLGEVRFELEHQLLLARRIRHHAIAATTQQTSEQLSGSRKLSNTPYLGITKNDSLRQIGHVRTTPLLLLSELLRHCRIHCAATRVCCECSAARRAHATDLETEGMIAASKQAESSSSGYNTAATDRGTVRKGRRVGARQAGQLT